MARNGNASVAERTAAGAITFNSNISVGGISTFTGQTAHAGGIQVNGPGGAIANMSVTNGLVERRLSGGSTLTLMRDGVQLDLSADLNNQVGIYSPGADATGFCGLRLSNEFTGGAAGSEVQGLRISSRIGKQITNYYGAYVDQITELANSNITGESIAYYVRGSFEDHTNGGAKYSFCSASANVPALLIGGLQFSTTHSTGGTQDQLKLDYYEEGTFTPVLRFTSSDSSGSVTPVPGYSNTGYYTRVGDMVTVLFDFRFNTQNLAEGSDPQEQLAFEGLPFAEKNILRTGAMARGSIVIGSQSLLVSTYQGQLSLEEEVLYRLGCY